jgi:hypothetical protein
MERLLTPNEVCTTVISLRTSDEKQNADLNAADTLKRVTHPLFTEVIRPAVKRAILKEFTTGKRFEDVLSHHDSVPSFLAFFPQFDSAVVVRNIAIALQSFIDICIMNQYSDFTKVKHLLSAFNALLSNPSLMSQHRSLLMSAFFVLFERSMNITLMHIVLRFFELSVIFLRSLVLVLLHALICLCDLRVFPVHMTKRPPIWLAALTALFCNSAVDFHRRPSLHF